VRLDTKHMTQKRIYLDYAASTPVDPLVIKAMTPYFDKIFANPHSLHQFGQEASRAVFEARRKLAESIGADYKQIVFTGSATEANNLAIRGIAKSIKYQVSSIKYPRIITTTIEHESVLETCRDLERDGVEVVYIPVSRDGIVDLKKLKAALNERTILVSIMHANNEIGTVQPISEIAEIVRNFRNSKHEARNSKQIQNSNSKTKNNNVSDLEAALPLLHTDAAQSFQYLDCNVDKLGVDLMTLSAHKIYGPKGIGALYVRSSMFDVRIERIAANIQPIITGSGQEFGLRSGTDNVSSIIGFAKAVEIADQVRAKEAKRVGELRDYFWRELQKVVLRLRSGTKKLVVEPACPALAVVEALQINGSIKNRLPNNLNIYFPGHTAQELLIKLDLAGIAASPGAACSTRVSKISYVLEALGFTEKRAGGSLRFSLGRQTIKKDIDSAIKVIAWLAERKF